MEEKDKDKKYCKNCKLFTVHYCNTRNGKVLCEEWICEDCGTIY